MQTSTYSNVAAGGGAQLNQAPSNSQQQVTQVSSSVKDPSSIVLTNASATVYKPFVSEKQLITTMAWQENQITATIRTFTELIPKNSKIYKDYGERMLTQGERLRLTFSQAAPEAKDFTHMLLLMAQFFEIIGRLYSQNYNNVSMEMEDQLTEAVSVVRSHKDLNLSEKALKILPKAQSIHEQAEKQKSEFERVKRETQDSLQKVKNSKQDPNLIYNLTEKQGLEEKASRAVKDLEEKKSRYNATVEQLEEKNKQFVAALEELSKEHQGLVDFNAESVKRFLESVANGELNHYEGLNIIAPEKGQVIKNSIIKQDIVSDIKAAEDMSLKIDLNYARGKLQDLPEPASNHSGISGYCQYISDTYEFYSKVIERAGKFLAVLQGFLGEINSSERQLAKQYKDFAITDRKRKENVYGPFQGQVLEFFRVLEQKEKIHAQFSRNMDAIVAKTDQIVKSYRSDEKTFVYSLQKITKDVSSMTDKVSKQSSAQEKQLSKISELLKGNFQGQNEKMTSFQNLMIEYQNITDALREGNSSYKTFVIQQTENVFELVRSFKQSQSTVLKALTGVIQNVVNQESILIDSHHKLQKDFISFVQILDCANLINQFKCQIVNKQQADLYDSLNQQDLDGADQPPIVTEIYEDDLVGGGGSAPTKLHLPDSPNNNNPDGVGSSDQIFEFNPSELTDKKLITKQHARQSLHAPQYESTSEDLGKEEFDDNVKGARSKSSRMEQNLKRTQDNQSLIIKDPISIDMRKSVIVKNDYNQGSFAADNHKLSQSVYQRQSIAQDNILSPLKKQFGKLVNKKEDIRLDEQTQREIDQHKLNMAPNQQQLDDSDENLRKLTANCKFIQEKFFGLVDDETCLQSYACAISMKILIQGRLYVTNKRLCFHSYFNDKTIFGKETKILIPLANIARVEKKTNVMVFDNSISIFTKEEREIFITSFMFRDQAHELINQQLEKLNGVSSPDPRVMSNDESQRQILPSEVGSSDDLEPKQEQDAGNEEFKEAPEILPPPAIYDNAEFIINPEFRQAELERIEQMKKTFPDIDKFPLLGYEDKIECSLKHLFRAFLNFGKKFSQYENLSIMEWLDKYPLTNVECVYDKPGIFDAPSYFNNSEEAAPLPGAFKNWPLSSRYTENMIHITEKPKMMQPKSNKTNLTVDTIYLSPRMIIRRTQFGLEGVPFSDSFNFESKFTFEQEEQRLPNGSFTTKIKFELRVNIVKPIRFIQGTVVKETENSLRDTYCTGPYREMLFSKILEAKEYLRQAWTQQQQQSVAQQPVKPVQSGAKKRETGEEQKGQGPKEPEQAAPPIQMLSPVTSSMMQQSGPIQQYPSESSKEIKAIHDELLRMTQLTQKLIYLVAVAIALNLVMVTLYVLK